MHIKLQIIPMFLASFVFHAVQGFLLCYFISSVINLSLAALN